MGRILITFAIINLFGFLSMWIDKRKAQNGSMRISEKTLLTIALLGGSIGSIIGMYTFRHKTKKDKFKYGVPFIIALQIAIVIYIIVKM